MVASSRSLFILCTTVPYLKNNNTSVASVPPTLLQTVFRQNQPNSPGLLLTPNLFVRRLTPAELRDKRERGICYNCDWKWSHGHHYQNKFLILLGKDDDEVLVEEIPPAAAAPNVDTALGDI